MIFSLSLTQSVSHECKLVVFGHITLINKALYRKKVQNYFPKKTGSGFNPRKQPGSICY